MSSGQTGFDFTEEFQLKIAAMLVKNPTFYRDYVDRIEVSFFTDNAVGAVVGVLKQWREKYTSHPDPESLNEYFRNLDRDDDNREVFDTRLMAVTKADGLKAEEFTRELIKKFLMHSAVHTALFEIIDDVTEKNQVDSGMIKKLRDALAAGDVNESDGLTYENAVQVLKDEIDPDKSGHVSTGLPHLDQCLGGGLRPGELGILLAGPKGFKSGTLVNFAKGANARGIGKRVDYFSLELSEELQILRYCFCVSGLGRNDLIADPAKFIRIMDKRKRLLMDNRGEFRVKFMPPYACTPNTLRAYLDKQVESGRKLGVVCVDYLDLMGADSKSDKDYLDAVQICTDLRQIAIDYKVPVWTAARATREAVGKKRINMSMMSKAFERIAIADYVLALCHTEEEKIANRMRIVPVASRNDGGDKIIECKWVPRVMSLRSIEARDISDDDFEETAPRGSKKGEGREKAKESLKDLVEAGRSKAQAAAREKEAVEV